MCRSTVPSNSRVQYRDDEPAHPGKTVDSCEYFLPTAARPNPAAARPCKPGDYPGGAIGAAEGVRIGFAFVRLSLIVYFLCPRLIRRISRQQDACGNPDS